MSDIKSEYLVQKASNGLFLLNALETNLFEVANSDLLNEDTSVNNKIPTMWYSIDFSTLIKKPINIGNILMRAWNDVSVNGNAWTKKRRN